MEFPVEYRAPKVENLATKASVAWGAVCDPGSSPTGDITCTIGPSATSFCANGGTATLFCDTGTSG